MIWINKDIMGYKTIENRLSLKQRNKTKAVILVLIVTLVFNGAFLTGCGEEGVILGERAAPTGITEVVERVIYLPMEKVRTLNPMISRDEDAYIISKLVYDSLFELDHYMMPQKRLVESFYFSDDRMSLHIVLREEIFWHDGREFTATDVRFSIENYINLGNGTIFADYVANIRAVTVPRGETHSLTISFRNPYNVGVENLVFPILPMHQFPRSGDLHRNIETFEPLGTGPYRVVSFNSFDRLILEPNPYYHGTIPRNNIEFVIFPNKDDAINLVNVGRISLFISDDIERETIVHGMNANAVNFVSNRAEFVAFNINHELFRDVMIRQAVAYAIDAREILETAYLNSGVLSNTIFFPFFFGNENYEELFPYDLERAAELLEQAGLRMVEDSYYLHDRVGNEVRIGILVNSNNSARMAAAQIIKNALDNLSLYSYIIYVDWEEYIARINAGDFDLYIGGYAFNERFDLRFLLHSRHNNRIGFSNSEVDRLLDEMQSGLSNEEKAQVFQELNAILQQEVPIFCLLYKTFGAISSVSLRGDINPRFNHVFYNPGEWVNVYAISAVVAE